MIKDKIIIIIIIIITSNYYFFTDDFYIDNEFKSNYFFSYI